MTSCTILALIVIIAALWTTSATPDIKTSSLSLQGEISDLFSTRGDLGKDGNRSKKLGRIFSHIVIRGGSSNVVHVESVPSFDKTLAADEKLIVVDFSGERLNYLYIHRYIHPHNHFSGLVFISGIINYLLACLLV